jgi:hypothetical protein
MGKNCIVTGGNQGNKYSATLAMHLVELTPSHEVWDWTPQKLWFLLDGGFFLHPVCICALGLLRFRTVFISTRSSDKGQEAVAAIKGDANRSAHGNYGL